jgi:cardiolipin synthase
MLKEIDAAQSHVLLSTYIFETNGSGVQFIDALARAAARGVDTRVIVDGIGELYSHPRAASLLAKRGVNVARFLPLRPIPPQVHINLRNHRKILVADGRVAFTGGMNIGDRHLADRMDNPRRVTDVHVRISGPIVGQLQRVFLEDGSFVTGHNAEDLPVAPAEVRGVQYRTIAEGPNEDLDKLLSPYL